MFKSSVEHYVQDAVRKNVASDSITKDELTAVVTDSIYSFVTSRDFRRLLEDTLDK